MGGLLFVKVMDCRKDGKLHPHHITVTNLLTNFELIDLAVYIRQGANDLGEQKAPAKSTWLLAGLQKAEGSHD